MLLRLYIQNYAIISELEIHFENGLNIITGETGAGKSIILGALGLILGNRADKSVLHDTGRKCIIEAEFVKLNESVLRFLQIHELEEGDDLIIRREISSSGKSRAFINDTPVVLNTLNEISKLLIDLHRQFDQLDIQKSDFQLSVIDALAGSSKNAKDYSKTYQKYLDILEELKKLETEQENAAAEKDFIQFQFDELLNADLKEDEKEKLEEEQNFLSHAEEIRIGLDEIYKEIELSELSILQHLQTIAQRISKLSKYDQNINEISERLHGLNEELKDLSNEIVSVASNTEFDPSRLEEINDRLELIYRLENKHRVGDIRSLINLRDQFESKLLSFSDLTSRIQLLANKKSTQFEKVQSLANALSKKRTGAFGSFENSIKSMLDSLAMPQANFKVHHEQLNPPEKNGIDKIHFNFSANKGHELQELVKVASGGEISRLNLCIKSLIAGALALPTLIFDEIDSGVSGEVARKLGTILTQLAQNHQLIVITHSPQIAACADHHLFVYKYEENEMTRAKIKLLDEKQQILEIAKMLSGDPPSAVAMNNAKELISYSKQPA